VNWPEQSRESLTCLSLDEATFKTYLGRLDHLDLNTVVGRSGLIPFEQTLNETLHPLAKEQRKRG
jgi:hypothetical protein